MLVILEKQINKPATDRVPATVALPNHQHGSGGSKQT
jgi:hypothetical protein